MREILELRGIGGQHDIAKRLGISEWRQAGPLIALITGTSIFKQVHQQMTPFPMNAVDALD